ncbi:hypothetical protein K3718_04645 [Leisingera aquaemixtae]|uniref:Polymerase nucleotidyl transferase domain-containing protein n=1 Tax=Leisingera aquaemixtae TaxID=1396826 RepID=A0ABY5WLS6_9RHOB|nr:hypothetical protein [Leisingera aquaemixtae]UWQ42382.1 hypothetical protein K3718_04645 [Leisingera aquaemixtae]
MSDNNHNTARQEFLTDSAAYFADKKDLYLQVKDDIALELGIPLSMIRICGSAYWGKSFTAGRGFLPGESDLDVALINEALYVQCLSEVRQTTRNFSNLTAFRSGQNTPLLFQDYAYKKGIIRTDVMPSTRTKKRLDAASNVISRKYAEHFSKVSFSIYDSESSFTVKQISPVRKFRT